MSDSSLLPIKDLRHLLQRRSLGLRIEEVHGKQFNKKPYIIDNVILPANSLECDGIDVIVEEESGVDAEEHDGKTLSAEGIGNDFDGVCDKETGPGKGVRGSVKDEH